MFSLDIEGGQENTGSIDLFDLVGPATAYTVTYEDIEVTDGSLTVTMTATDREGKLSGFEVTTFGNPSPITASPNPVNFFVAEVGGSSLERPVTVTNSGTDPLEITGVTFSGADAAQFASTFSQAVTIPAGETASIGAVFDPTSSGVKTAQMEIAFNGEGSPSKATLTGEAVSVANGNVLYRVNAGGRALAPGDGLRIWTEDQTLTPAKALGQAQAGAPSPFVNAGASGDNTFGTLDSITLDGSVPASTPAALFQTERWDLDTAPNQTWSFPVPVGTEVEVRVYLAEIFLTEANNDTDGPRLFDISVDGTVPAVFDNIDVCGEVGHDVGLMKSFALVSDGAIDLELIQDGGKNLPAVKGIEILDRTSIARDFNEGWNLVGLPLTVVDGSFTSLFGTLNPAQAPLAWNGSAYAEQQSLVNGSGYFLEVGAGGLYTF